LQYQYHGIFSQGEQEMNLNLLNFPILFYSVSLNSKDVFIFISQIFDKAFCRAGEKRL